MRLGKNIFNGRNRIKNSQKINEIIKDIKRNGNEGIGKPEPLKHELSGYWSRRITDKHRFIYIN